MFPCITATWTDLPARTSPLQLAVARPLWTLPGLKSGLLRPGHLGIPILAFVVLVVEWANPWIKSNLEKAGKGKVETGCFTIEV